MNNITSVADLALLDDNDLLDLYSDLVRDRHYSPMGMSDVSESMRDAGVSLYDIKDALLARMAHR
jgi:hypothetical protein